LSARSQFPERDNIFIQDNIPGVWGGASLVAATTEAMRAALSLSRSWRHFINLSGADLPLKSQSEIFDDLNLRSKQGQRTFITEYGIRPYSSGSVRVDATISEVNEIPFRGVRFHVAGQARSIFQSVKQGPITNAKIRASLHVSESFGPKALHIRPLYAEEDRFRSHFFSKTPYGLGRQWLIADRELCESICGTLVGSEVFEVVKSTFIPDECYFQIASRHVAAPHVVRNDNLRFRRGAPVALDDTFLPELKESAALFARKVIEGRCPELIDWVWETTGAGRQV
jgi:hypothetical protein